LEEQLHAIWYCIPTDNEARLLSGPEQELLRQCKTGPVPLIVIFTKFDSLEAKAFRELKLEGLARQQAQERAPGHASGEFRTHHLPYLFGKECPQYMCLRKMHKEQNNAEIQKKMAELIQKTVDSMDVDALKQLLVSVQKNNLQLCIEYAVKYGPMKEIAAEVSAAGAIVTTQQLKILIEGLLDWFGYIVKILLKKIKKEKKDFFDLNLDFLDFDFFDLLEKDFLENLEKDFFLLDKFVRNFILKLFLSLLCLLGPCQLICMSQQSPLASSLLQPNYFGTHMGRGLNCWQSKNAWGSIVHQVQLMQSGMQLENASRLPLDLTHRNGLLRLFGLF